MLLSISTSTADDWTANKLRGRVLQLIDHQWIPLQRGMVVPDDRVIRTLGGAQVQFARGQETIDLGANTQIQIHDRGTAGKPNTTVQQYFGTVSVEAQVELVQHFAVQTAYLAAVVKGTRFTVTSGESGAAVTVQRGHVAVEDNHDKSHVTLSVGQSASVDRTKTEGAITVAGKGVLPIVVDRHGKPVVPHGSVSDAKQTAAKLATAAKIAEQKAKELKTPEAKAAADAAKKTADAAKKEADQASKDEKKAADDAKKAADQSAKEQKDSADKAAKGAAKGDGGSSGSTGSSGSGNGGGSGGGGGSGDGGKDKPDKRDKKDK